MDQKRWKVGTEGMRKDEYEPDDLGPLPTSIGKPLVVLEIVAMLKNRASYLREQGMVWARQDAEVFDEAAKMVEERFLK